MKKLCLVLFSIALAGCAIAPSPNAQKVIDADAAMVHGCQFVGTVNGSSGWGNLAASAGMNNARIEAREQAAGLGANRIVWVNITGGYSPYVTGNAYLCK